MKCFAYYTNREKKRRPRLIELQYSSLHFISGGKKWFCRVWTKNNGHFGSAYGSNKFEAYRLALVNLFESKIKAT